MNNAYMESTDQVLVHTYNRFPVIFDHGDGVHLYDEDGKEYLDFAAGIAVSSLGYGNPEIAETMKNQIDKLCHISNLYYTKPILNAATRLKAASQMDRVFFTNSGTEAIEGALKSARKYAYSKNNGRFEFIAMEHSFHGRSMGALSVTGTEKYRTPFEPLVGGVKFAKYNNLESVKALITDKTCAVIMETLQGEGGIYPAEKEFLQGVKQLCEENDMLLILDEIQCGMGRTGTMFAWQDYDVKPDIMCMAKAIGNGVPVGAFAMTEQVAEYSLAPGDHGTTYGGGPLVCATVDKVLEIFERDHIVDHVKEVAPYLEEKLDELVEKYDIVTARRGKGLIQGLVVTKPVGQIVNAALEEGLVVISAGSDVVRFVPPLVITRADVDEMIVKLEKAIVKANQ
ncbi:aspartate aminotransferase family protein [Hespellia stercorisuis]|uniref:Acetylornithine aminotransferase n=1 Tax=Hespellia stercorisuis DSM 15480 TaxID=1121950 RepID=A0A1M6MPS8_9FIRM|nr:aspartate aminotransferase family protein [Hespellia stercorisuis]SHJ85370.1 acetylornithine/N-succinyldiaminopimelate aminotransferase [Hespellia stercorisuis DSM 15480]